MIIPREMMKTSQQTLPGEEKVRNKSTSQSQYQNKTYGNSHTYKSNQRP